MYIGLAPAVNLDEENCVLNFSPMEDVDYAFYKLQLSILNMTYKRFTTAGYPNEGKNFMLKIFHYVMTESIFWNFLDIRLLEAIALASMIPAAQKPVENYKRAFFNKKLSEVMRDYQYLPFIKFIGERNEHLYEDSIKICDCQQMTIGDFHKHRLYLETSLFHVGEGTIALRALSIYTGSVDIMWQINVDLLHQVFHTLSKHKETVQNIANFYVSEVQRWKDLPVLLRGEEEEIGPIDLLEHRNMSYPLMEGYIWDKLNPENIKEIAALNEQPVGFCVERFCRWVTSHPYFSKEFFIAVRSGVTHNKQLVGFTLSYPFTMQFGKVSNTRMIYLKYGMNMKYQHHQILKTLYKETMRIANLYGISQAVFPYLTARIIKPFTRLSIWLFEFSFMQLPRNSILTPGWRKMKKRDISVALAFMNKYTMPFEIKQVFTSKKEFSHHFLCPNIPNYITTYVVEDKKSGEITDIIGYKIEILNDTLTCAYITAIISTKTPVRQLLADLLICVKESKADILQTLQFGFKDEIFENLFYRCSYYRYWYPYNFNYPEIPESKVYVFGHY